MSTEKHWRLLELLIERTAEDYLAWDQTAVSNSFSTTRGPNSITISSSPNSLDEEVEDYIVTISNAGGEIVDRFSDEDLSTELGRSTERKPYAKMRTLYQMARRKALGADRILDDLISDLELPF